MSACLNLAKDAKVFSSRFSYCGCLSMFCSHRYKAGLLRKCTCQITACTSTVKFCQQHYCLSVNDAYVVRRRSGHDIPHAILSAVCRGPPKQPILSPVKVVAKRSSAGGASGGRGGGSSRGRGRGCGRGRGRGRAARPPPGKSKLSIGGKATAAPTSGATLASAQAFATSQQQAKVWIIHMSQCCCSCAALDTIAVQPLILLMCGPYFWNLHAHLVNPLHL